MSDRIVSVINVNRIVGDKAVSMARAQNLTEIDVGETATIIFDFAPITQGETLSGAPTLSCVVSQGVDPEPASRLIGAASIVPSPSTGDPALAVSQQIGTMIGGVLYALQCIATAAPNAPSLWARILCVQPD
jgi:hypothetical protein